MNTRHFIGPYAGTRIHLKTPSTYFRDPSHFLQDRTVKCQCLLGALALGDVVRGAHDMGDAIQFDHGGRHEAVSETPVFFSESSLEIVHAPLRPQTLHESLAILGTLPDRQLDRCLADDILFGIPHDVGKALIDRHVHSVGKTIDIYGIGTRHERFAESLLAFPQGIFDALSLRYVLRKNDDAPDGSVSPMPGSHLPTNPVDRPIRPLKRILIAFFHGAGKTAAMDFLPGIGDLGKDFVMAAPNDGGVSQTIVLNPASAHDEIAHVAIEHGNGGGAMLHVQAQLLLSLAKRFFGLLASCNVFHDGNG